MIDENDTAGDVKLYMKLSTGENVIGTVIAADEVFFLMKDLVSVVVTPQGGGLLSFMPGADKDDEFKINVGHVVAVTDKLPELSTLLV